MKGTMKIAALIFALLLVGLTAAARGGPEEEEVAAAEPANPAPADAVQEPGVEKPEKITAVLDIWHVSEEAGQSYFYDAYEELTGVELEVIQPPHAEYQTKVNLLFASGDFPDIVELEDIREFVNHGALVLLDPYIAESEVFQRVDEQVLGALQVKGNIFAIPTARGSGTVTYVRKDWLDALGKDIPSTYDEFYDVLWAFAYEDPDGNGEDDTVGLTAQSVTFDMYLRPFLLDATFDFVYQNGKWIDGLTQPNAKAALERFARAYQDGLIDQEIFTNGSSACRSKFFGNKVGVFTYWTGNWAVAMDEKAKEQMGEDVEVVPIPALEGGHYTSRVPVGNGIPMACENPAGVFKYFLEFMHDGAEGQMLFTHGVEGIHWNKDGGEYLKMEYMNKPGITFTNAYLDIDLPLYPWDDPFELDPRITYALELLTDNGAQMLMLPSSAQYNETGADITTLKDEVVAKVLLGELTVEQGLERYESEAAELGLEQILTEFNM